MNASGLAAATVSPVLTYTKGSDLTETLIRYS